MRYLRLLLSRDSCAQCSVTNSANSGSEKWQNLNVILTKSDILSKILC